MKSTLDKIATYLHEKHGNPAIIIVSEIGKGNVKKMRGFFQTPCFLLPESFFVDFDDAKKGYDLVCIAVKNK